MVAGCTRCCIGISIRIYLTAVNANDIPEESIKRHSIMAAALETLQLLDLKNIYIIVDSIYMNMYIYRVLTHDLVTALELRNTCETFSAIIVVVVVVVVGDNL